MKRRLYGLIVSGLILMSITGCGKKETVSEMNQESTAETIMETDETSAEANSNDIVSSLTNEWTDVTKEDVFSIYPVFLMPQEDFTDIKWRAIKINDEAPIVEMSCTIPGLASDTPIIARAQKTADKNADITGLKYDWTSVEDDILPAWSEDGQVCEYKMYDGGDQYVHLCTWYDDERQTSYAMWAYSKDVYDIDVAIVANFMRFEAGETLAY